MFHNVGSVVGHRLYVDCKVFILLKALSILSQKRATVVENGETTATIAEFGDSRTYLRQCGQGFTLMS